MASKYNNSNAFAFRDLAFYDFYSIYYIFKCGLHYLAMFKLFQRIIFACLSYIVYCNDKNFFSFFQFDFSGYFTEFKLSSPILN